MHVLVVGHNAAAAAKEAAKIGGVTKVLLADAAQFADGLAEPVAAQVVSMASGYSHVFASATAYGKNIMPRVAAKLDAAQISDISSVESADTFTRPIYAGNAIATVQSSDPIKVVTARPTNFEPAPSAGGSATVETIAAVAGADTSRFVSRDVVKLTRPELQGAKIVISGGRGIGSAENFKLLEPLADKLNAAIGASRAAVDAGYAPNDWQVGQTGKVVAPQLYIAVGISGAIQHLAGMKDSKVIVAINKDRRRRSSRLPITGSSAICSRSFPKWSRSSANSMSYVAPVKDMLFVLNELAGLKEIQQLPGCEDATDETVQAVIAENARFMGEVVAPLNWNGDIQPAKWDNGKVTTTPGFKAAFRSFVEAGWQGIQHPTQYGGQDLPKVVAAPCMEMMQAANLSFALCPLLTDGAIEALLVAGSQEQKDAYLGRLIDGSWTGTMNLTEPQAGSDLAQVRTKAVPQSDGTYRLFGQKIYITYGEHDLADNIAHLVLARTPDAPAGVKGISLFIVPKFCSTPTASSASAMTFIAHRSNTSSASRRARRAC